MPYNFIDEDDINKSISAIRNCIGREIGVFSQNPKKLTGMEVFYGKENIEKELTNNG